MAIRFASGYGFLYEKETSDFPAARIHYQLSEIEATRYTSKRW